MKENRECTLMTLPLELRLHVYSQLFKICNSQTHSFTVTIGHLVGTYYGEGKCRLSIPKIGLGPLLICRQVHAEIVSHLFTYFDRSSLKNDLPDVSACPKQRQTFTQLTGPMTHVSCELVMAPMLFRAQIICLAKDEIATLAAEVRTRLKFKPSQSLDLIGSPSAFLQDVYLGDDSGLLFAITQPEDWGNAKLYTRESVPRNKHFKHIQQLRRCIHAFGMVLSQEHRHVPVLNIYPTLQVIQDRKMVVDFERVFHDQPIQIHVDICGVTERWYEIAEARVKATLHLDSFAVQNFTFQLSPGQAKKKKRNNTWHQQDGYWFTHANGTKVPYEQVCGHNPD